MLQNSVVATNRFGFGAKNNEIKDAENDPKTWLLSQLLPISFSKTLPDSLSILAILSDFRMLKRKEKKQSKNASNSPVLNTSPVKELRKKQRLIYRELVVDSFNHILEAENSISWRVLDFFSNHFSVSAQGPLSVLAPTLEREAIAPNIMGNFEDLLLAVIKHPAMLLYLNNERSFGPNSRYGKRGKGLNENLAREILELHTLGVKGPYTQQDVIELAKGISGWSVTKSANEKVTGFTFRSKGHEPGIRELLSKKYAPNDVKQGEDMLIDLARHPSTAHFICFKLVRHFVNDTPNPLLVNALKKTWLATRGNIKAVMSTLIQDDLAWQPDFTKLKTPREFVISVYRALNITKAEHKLLFVTLSTLGQAPFKAGSPAGYPDTQKHWDGANALMAKIKWVDRLVRKGRYNAEVIMNNALSLPSSNHTYQQVVRAESRQMALTLLFLSPEFLRR